MKKQLIRAAATTVLGLSLTTGFAAASPGGTIGVTGPHSTNKIINTSTMHQSVSNHNNIGVGNVNLQSANPGDAHSGGSTEGGGASTGNASNSSSSNTS